ncbi:ATP-binding protein [Arcobacter arenosus]|uniref:ATP-binding protein n=1 Tax=Arcobacter arenosus TaxID=2576037 RepID=UPI003BAC1F3D
MSSTFNYENLKLFYIGKEKVDERLIPLVYKNKQLTTHAAIIGMTGSGKTGLGISLLEEAAIDNIPSIIIDPKGDMGNLLLTFPKLRAKDFEPWIEEQDAINSSMSVTELAQKTASLWENGLLNDFQNKDRIGKLKNSADFTIYTPGSTSGVPVSVLASFKAPSKEILDDADILNQLVNSTVSSLLSLVEIKESSSSKEHILLSSIFMDYYYQGKDLSLEELISNIVSPPFKKVGIFDLDTFFASEDRLKFALKLNSIIANPSFKTWIEGEPLDISKMLYDENGKAKVSIFSISHLNDSQRMFFVSLLLNQMVAWMRRQEGTSSLKALLYMDEIFGYFPPSKNPPTKQPMLTLLKQARSFGVGVILSTQNPVDLDYKGLSNIGTWFIGRLQTKQDKEKVIDGLTTGANSNLDKKELFDLLSKLEKRNFIMKNIHEDTVKVFKTRWVLSYLKGPISKEDIKQLMSEKIKKTLIKNKEETDDKKSLRRNLDNSTNNIKPIVPNELEELYLYKSQNDSYQMQPYLLASSEINFYSAAKDIDLKKQIIEKIYLDETNLEVNWDENELLKEKEFTRNEKINSSYYNLPNFMLNIRDLKEIHKDFTNRIYKNNVLILYKNKPLKLLSKQNESLEDFKIRIQDRLNENIDEEVEKLQIKFQRDEKRLENKLNDLYVKLEREKDQATAKTTDTLISIGSSILGAFFGKSSSNRTNIGRAASGIKNATKVLKERKDVKFVESEIEEVSNEISSLNQKLKIEIEKIKEAFNFNNYEIEEEKVKLRRKDIYNVSISLLWEEV